MRYGYNSGGRWAVSDGRKPSKEYAVWHSLMARCYNHKNPAYANYGGKGITVFEDWHDFQVFAQWYSENSVEGWVMDKDCAGGTVYSPDTVIFIPDQVNQHLKCYDKPMHAVRKSTNTWFVRSTTVDGEQFTKGKFTSPEAAAEFYQGYIRLKMVALIKKWNIPAATAERLIAL